MAHFKVYGFIKGEEPNESSLKEMSTVSLNFYTKEDCREFLEFVTNCLRDMEAHGDDFGHDHFFNAAEDTEVIIDLLLDVNK